MNSWSFKNRVAFFYMVATALIVAVLFFIVFYTVQGVVFNNVDQDLRYEGEMHTKEVSFKVSGIEFINKAEWEEREHREIRVHPVFVQIVDLNNNLQDKSPNLKDDFLIWKKGQEDLKPFNTLLSNLRIRQIQAPIYYKKALKGYVLVAMSFEGSYAVLSILKNVLLSAYPIVLIGLFFISRFLAGKSIKSVKVIANETKHITQYNLNDRITVPQAKDELQDLALSVNSLLQRIENALTREKQFTSDASHELRTPLSSLKGTLEVLIRKPRTPEEYQEKIQFGLKEIDKMTMILEQLLLLARMENRREDFAEKISLKAILVDTIEKYQAYSDAKNINIRISIESADGVEVLKSYFKLILENIVSNAIKYSKNNGNLEISYSFKEGFHFVEIKDDGVGIEEKDLSHIFSPFYRSEALSNKNILGNGLGLSIAKKAADAADVSIFVSSVKGEWTKFTLKF